MHVSKTQIKRANVLVKAQCILTLFINKNFLGCGHKYTAVSPLKFKEAIDISNTEA